MILQPSKETGLGRTSGTFQYLSSLQESWKGTLYEGME